MKVSHNSVGDEQGGCQKGRGCVDKIFALKIMVEKYLEVDRKPFAAFIDLRECLLQGSQKGPTPRLLYTWTTHRLMACCIGALKSFDIFPHILLTIQDRQILRPPLETTKNSFKLTMQIKSATSD